MIRVVLAVALTTALFGIALPSAERVDRERSAALAIDELESVGDTAERLVAGNDPIAPGDDPAGTTVVVRVPDPTFVEGGRIRIDDGELRWEPPDGPNHTVEPSVPLRVEAPIVVTDRTRLRLSFVSLDDRAVVLARPKAERSNGTRV